MSQLQARNEAIIDAPINSVWDIITDINQLHKINPGVIHARGRMDILGATRTCHISNNGKKGEMTEKLVELVPQTKTVWTIESDTMGMGKMLRHTKFIFLLEKISDSRTRVVSETHYEPANFLASMLNKILIRKKITNAQEQILANIKSII